VLCRNEIKNDSKRSTAHSSHVREQYLSSVIPHSYSALGTTQVIGRCRLTCCSEGKKVYPNPNPTIWNDGEMKVETIKSTAAMKKKIERKCIV
jgi:hypothetical protein